VFSIGEMAAASSVPGLNLPTPKDFIRAASLSVLCQPIVSLDDDRVVAHELFICGPGGETPEALSEYPRHEGELAPFDRQAFVRCLEETSRLPAGRVHVNLVGSTPGSIPARELISAVRATLRRASLCIEVNVQQIRGDRRSIWRQSERS